jgi:hypothetical protein
MLFSRGDMCRVDVVQVIWAGGRAVQSWILSFGPPTRHQGPQSRTRLSSPPNTFHQSLDLDQVLHHTHTMAVGNRKERRANESKTATTKSASSSFQPSNELDDAAVNFLLKHPDRSGPKGKTLFELAEERQKELDKAKPAGWNAKTRRPSATTPAAGEEAAIGAFGDALLYSTSMTALHLTLDVIVYSQYREDIIWGEIFQRAATAWPVFILLVYLTHVDLSYRLPILRDMIFCTGSIVAGCYLVYSGNKHGYFYVMKAAPPVGTLWIWSVVEMTLPYAALNVVAVLGYVWYNGFDYF